MPNGKISKVLSSPKSSGWMVSNIRFTNTGRVAGPRYQVGGGVYLELLAPLAFGLNINEV